MRASSPQLISSSICLCPARRSRRRTRPHTSRAPIRRGDAPIAVRRPTGDCSGHRIASSFAVQVVRRCLLVHCVASDAFEWRVRQCRRLLAGAQREATRRLRVRRPSGWWQHCSGTARKGASCSSAISDTRHHAAVAMLGEGVGPQGSNAREKKKKKEKPPFLRPDLDSRSTITPRAVGVSMAGKCAHDYEEFVHRV